ncbi:hypothetical protein [Candidatus Accumulibacter sp. ACC003]|uniref:hypothetical protein n=1 Tax=Candidatus Accumulibacter sp. ACC003 TaxID=2823334 RepID=UPI0025BB1671|nr:hypothetical protein [Candidatus Accumulibacter sp. ACC003]
MSSEVLKDADFTPEIVARQECAAERNVKTARDDDGVAEVQSPYHAIQMTASSREHTQRPAKMAEREWQITDPQPDA